MGNFVVSGNSINKSDILARVQSLNKNKAKAENGGVLVDEFEGGFGYETNEFS